MNSIVNDDTPSNEGAVEGVETPITQDLVPTADVVQHVQDSTVSEYRVVHPLDIAATLLDLKKSKGLIRLIAEGTESITSVVEVDRDAKLFYFEPTLNSDVNASWKRAKKLYFSGQSAGIRVSFSTGSPRLVQHDGYDTFVVPFPEYLLRLQHRRFFRARGRVLQPFQCTFYVQRKEELVPITGYIYDVSLGGVGVRFNAKNLDDFEVNKELTNTTLDFGEFGRIKATLRIANRRFLDIRSHNLVHLGCEFVGSLGADEPLLQRVIFKLERSGLVRD